MIVIDLSKIHIEKAEVQDAGDILGLQKTAYISEAQIINDFSIQPLNQKYDEIIEEFKTHTFLKALNDEVMIGSVRAHERDGTCYIGKLIVDPNYQNKGIGKKLMFAIEKKYSHLKRFELFTGEKSVKNLYLYDSLGYKIFNKNKISEKLTLFYLEKMMTE